MVAALRSCHERSLSSVSGAHQLGHLVAEHERDVVEVDAGVLDRVVQVRRADQVLGGAAGREQRRHGDRVQDVRLVAALALLPAMGAFREPQRRPHPLRVDHRASLLRVRPERCRRRAAGSAGARPAARSGRAGRAGSRPDRPPTGCPSTCAVTEPRYFAKPSGPSGSPQIANRSPSVWPGPATSSTPVGSRVTIGCSQAPDSTYGTFPTHGCRMPMPEGTSTTQASTNSSRCTPNGAGAGAPQGSSRDSTAPAVSVNLSPTPIGRGSGAYPALPQAASSRLTMIAAASGRSDSGRARTVRRDARGRGQGKRTPSMGQIASPGVPLFREARGDDQNRTGVDGFAGRCLATRPRRLAGASVATGRAVRFTPRIAVAMPESDDERGRGIQPEGRRRQDDDRRQRGVGTGAGGSADAARRPRSAGLRRPLAGDRRGGRPRHERAVRRQGQARRLLPGPPRAVPARRGRRRPGAGRRRGRAAGRRPPPRAPGHRASSACATASTGASRSSTCRRRWAVCPMPRCERPTACWCPLPPTSSRSTRCARRWRRCGRSRSPAPAPTCRSPCCRPSSTAAVRPPTPWRCCRTSSATSCWRAASRAARASTPPPCRACRWRWARRAARPRSPTTRRRPRSPPRSTARRRRPRRRAGRPSRSSCAPTCATRCARSGCSSAESAG